MDAPFHPDLARVARVLPRAVVSRRTLRLVRAATPLLGLRPARGVEVVELAGGGRVRVHRPPGSAAAGPAVLWAHGGGYVIGAAVQDDGRCRRLSRALGAVVVSVDYRLAPEHPYPAALDDCHAALRWLATLPEVDGGRIAVAGASAGAGLAAALALRARDEGGVQPCFQLLAYPMIDDRTRSSEGLDARHVRAWSPASNELGWRSYLGPPGQQVPPLAAPARAQDLSGLPPAWVGVGTLDLFHDEDVEYARRLRLAGVECALEVVPGAFHGFDVLAPWAGVSRAFAAAQVEALRRALLPSA